MSASSRDVSQLRDGLLLPAEEGLAEGRNWASNQRKDRSRSLLSLTLRGPDGALRITTSKSFHFLHWLCSVPRDSDSNAQIHQNKGLSLCCLSLPDCPMRRPGYLGQLERAMDLMSTERPGCSGGLLRRQVLLASRMSLVLCNDWLLCLTQLLELALDGSCCSRISTGFGSSIISKQAVLSSKQQARTAP